MQKGDNLKQNLGQFWKLIKLTGYKWDTANFSRMSAALAYYTLFSLAPVFIIVVAIFGSIFGEEAIKGEIVEKIQGIVGLQTAIAVQKMIEAGGGMAKLSLTNIFGILVIIYAATNVFSQLKSTLNQIWGVPPSPRHWVLEFFWYRLISFVMVLSIGLLLMCLVLIEIGLALLDELIMSYIPLAAAVNDWQWVNLFASFLIIALLFILIYRMLPDTDIAWRDVWQGACLASLLFTLGKFLIALYLSHSRTITLFGAASSFVVILVWVYASSQILLLGAAYSYFYAHEFGSLSAQAARVAAAKPPEPAVPDAAEPPKKPVERKSKPKKKQISKK